MIGDTNLKITVFFLKAAFKLDLGASTSQNVLTEKFKWTVYHKRTAPILNKLYYLLIVLANLLNSRDLYLDLHRLLMTNHVLYYFCAMRDKGSKNQDDQQFAAV